MYECPDCGELHEEQDDAKDCCPKEIVEMWVCSVCGEQYEDWDSAYSCCD